MKAASKLLLLLSLGMVPFLQTAAQSLTGQPLTVQPLTIQSLTMQPLTRSGNDCLFNEVWQLDVGASYTNECAIPAFVLSDSLYTLMLRSYNAVPSLLRAKNTSALIFEGMEQKIDTLQQAYDVLLELERKLTEVSLGAIDITINSIDDNTEELLVAADSIQAAQGRIGKAQAELKKLRFKDFLRGIAAFGAGVLVGALLQ